ncbi:MAG: glutamyl-tRNA reductase [Candidatus Altiarchaeota archaeon]|nr:glutamyl-tRNA reductase [Candidatus Altiarchaeota archaeon]
MLYNLKTTYRDIGIGRLGSKFDEFEGYTRYSELNDYVSLFTCNRAELYSDQYMNLDGLPVEKGRKALEHLFRVSCGLDSMILGENEILSQVKKAHRSAIEEGHCCEHLSAFFDSAIRLGKKARAKTRISHGKTSIASMAVDYAFNLGEFSPDKVLILGSGMLSGKIATALKNKGTEKILLSNRYLERARILADKVGGKAFGLDRLPKLLNEVEIVFSATSAPHPIITPDKIPRNREILLVDLAVPADVSKEVDRLKNVKVLRLDFFKAIAQENILAKKEEIKKVELMIQNELERFDFREAI